MRHFLIAAAAISGMPGVVDSATAASLFTSRSSSAALVANCPTGPLGNVCDSNYVLGSAPNAPGSFAEDYKPTQFGLDAQSYTILKPSPSSLSNGSAIAFTVNDPASDLPVLKAGAYTRPTDLGRYTTSYSYMSTLAAFTYTGTDALPLSLVGNIDYLLSFAPINYGAPFAPGSLPYSFTQVRARLVIGDETLYQGAGSLAPDSLVCGAGGVLASGGGFSGVGGYATGAASQSLTMTLDASSACGGGGPVIIHPGDNFYIYAFLETLAIQGGTVDATNSFHVRFTPDTPQSVLDAFASGAQAVGVPEPANWALMIAGFGLTGAMMRRRRVAVA